MACTNKENPDCPNCNKTGLAILPVRYAVVPDNVDAALPSSLGNKVTDIKLKHHKYALRTLRQGFVYLYYEKHARGSHIKWETYSVSASGTLWKQLSITALDGVEDEMCSRKGHNLPASVISIESPAKCGRVWMAFSEHAWSEETFKAFETDSKLRDRRMQTFAPAIWIKSRGYRHGLEVTESNLDEIIEYKSGFRLSSICGSNMEDFTKPDGSFKAATLNRRSTRYPVTVRRNDKKNLVDLMTSIGATPDGSGNAPIIIAFWDSVGITHELNGYRNDAAGWIEKYGRERELEIGALSAIEGIRRALEKRAGQRVQPWSDSHVFKWDSLASQKRLKDYERANPGNTAGHNRQADLCNRWEQDSADRIPSNIAARRGYFTQLPEAQWQARMADIDKAAVEAKTGTSATGESDAHARDERWRRSSTQSANRAFAEDWAKYEARISMSALNAFKQHYDAFLSAAAGRIDERTEDLIAWMTSQQLCDALTEFHPENLFDGHAFEQAVGDMIVGISSSPSGLSLVKTWIAETNVNDHNLLWRSFALNQHDGINALNGVLAAVVAGKDQPFTEQALSAAQDGTKYLAKFSDLIKKGLSLHNTLRKDGVYQVRTGGIEKLLMTVGHLFLQPYMKKGADLLSHGLISGLLLARSGVEYSKFMSLLVVEAKHAKLARAETLGMLKIGSAFGAWGTSASYRELQAKWTELAKAADTPKVEAGNPKLSGGFNAAKELRFAMVATLLQTVNLTKLYFDVGNKPGDERLRAELWVAITSTGAGVVDLGATAIKGLHNRKDLAISFQVVKLVGGVLSSVAAWLQFKQDLAKVSSTAASGQGMVSNIYIAKAGFTFVGGACSALATISYTEQLFAWIATKFPTCLVGRASAMAPKIVSKLAARLMIGRAVLMLGGIWFSLATIGIELLIWRFSDDELQVWCSRSAFGLEKAHRIKTAASQQTEFENALKEVL